MAALNEESLLESPDLLAKSISDTTSSPAKSVKQQKLITTPRKQAVNGTVKLQDFFLTTPPAAIARKSSPTRSIAQTENVLSPWKIRVTVQAEPQEEGMTGQKRSRRNSVSPSKATPSKRIRTSTVTTTVPLNDEDESALLPPRRGRPRKSDSSPAKRPGTPKPRKGRGKTSGGEQEEESATTSQSKSTPAKRPVGRPRKTPLRNVISTSELEDDRMGLDSASIPPSPSPAKITIRRGRGASKIDIAEDPVALSDDGIDQVEEDTQNHSADAGTRTLQSIIEGEASEFTQPRHPLMPTSPQKGRRRSPSKARLGEPSDPTLQHNEFDSIMESEGFSMVSLGSVPSARQHVSSAQQAKTVPKARSPTRDELSGSTENPVAQQKRNSSKRPSQEIDPNNSSQFFKLINQNTPSQPVSSPDLPPQVQGLPPSKSPATLKQTTSTTPKLVRVVRAGIALQGVIDPSKPDMASKTPGGQEAKGSRDRLDDLFAGFSAGTRRELRAGLRLGEELAKRQHLSNKKTASVQPNDDDDFDPFEEIAAAESSKPASNYGGSSTLAAPKVAQEVNYPITYPPLPQPKQLPSPEASHAEEEDEDKMDWKADTPGNTLYREPKLAESSAAQQKSQRDAEREAEWAREREAISRQAEEADKDNVVVISDGPSGGLEDSDVDSDENEEVEQTLDIWQMEAKSSSHLLNASRPTLAPAPVVAAQERLFPDEPLKPRRGKIPSPFRRQIATKLIYSDEVDDDEASLIPDYPSVNKSSPITPAVRKPPPRQIDGDFSALSEFTRPVNTLPGAPEGFSSPVKARDEAITMSVEQRVRKSLLGDNYEEELESSERDMSPDEEQLLPVKEEIRESIEKDDENIQPTVNDARPAAAPVIPKQTFPIRKASPEKPAEKSASASTPKNKPTPGGSASSGSWLGLVAKGVSNWFSPSAIDPKPATSKKSSTAASARSQPRPQPRTQPPPPPAHTQPSQNAATAFISIHAPFNHIHYSHLHRIYHKSLSSPIPSNYLAKSSHRHLHNTVLESHSWMKRLDARDIRAIDEFMKLLETQGRDLYSHRKGRAAPEKIDDEMVMQRVFGIWVAMVQRGEVGLKDGVEGEWDGRYVGRRDEILKEQRGWKRKNNAEHGSRSGRERSKRTKVRA